MNRPRVAITRPGDRSTSILDRLRGGGFDAVSYPLIAAAPPLDTEPVHAAAARLADYDWLVLTSARAVEAFSSFLPGPVPAAVRVAAVGRATAAACAGRLRSADVVPDRHDAAGLLDALEGAIEARRFLLPGADRARSTLADGLRRRGAAEVVSVVVYRTVPGPGVASLVASLDAAEVDALVLASPSAVEFLADALADVRAALVAVTIVCIGETTAAAVRAHGLTVAAVAADPSDDAIVDALRVLFQTAVDQAL